MSSDLDSKKNIVGKRRPGRPKKLNIATDLAPGSGSSYSDDRIVKNITPTPGAAHILASARDDANLLQSWPPFVTPSYSNLSQSQMFFSSSPQVQSNQQSYALVGRIPSKVTPSSFYHYGQWAPEQSSMPPPVSNYSDIVNLPQASNMVMERKREKSTRKRSGKSLVQSSSIPPTSSARKASSATESDPTTVEVAKKHSRATFTHSRKKAANISPQKSLNSYNLPQGLSSDSNDNAEHKIVANEPAKIHPRKQRPYIPPLESIYQQQDLLLFSPAYSDDLTFTIEKKNV